MTITNRRPVKSAICKRSITLFTLDWEFANPIRISYVGGFLILVGGFVLGAIRWTWGAGNSYTAGALIPIFTLGSICIRVH